jgi:transcriptional regulator with XRE-family HTH domain
MAHSHVRYFSRINQPEDPMSNIGKAVTKARTSADLTQIEVALAAEIGQSYLSQIENGKRTPTTDVLKRLARALGVKVSDLDAELA